MVKKTTVGKNDAESSGLTDNELSMIKKLDQAGEGQVVDIPLNQNLSEDHGVVNWRDDSKASLDFDLARTVGTDDVVPDSQVLSFNPMKSFSKPVELDLQSLDQQGFINPNKSDSPLTSAFRMIKRPLLNNAKGKGATKVDNGNLIMVTSSMGGEGKTFSAMNLAISIAMEKDKHVLLIDADVNKPSHHKVFNLPMEKGLTDFLKGEADDISEIMFKTNIPSLSLMFAGRQTALATELLASETMINFVHDISTRYPDRIVIFDSPPLLLTTEASVLASHMGQVVMVVEAEKTLRQQVTKSLGLLSNEIVLLLLNKMRHANESSYYGYYGYGQQS